MPIRRRPNGSWLIDIYHAGAPGGRLRKTVRGATPKRDVAALERRLVAELEAGAHRARRGPTVGATLARYWNEHGSGIASSATERGYLNAIADALGDGTPLADVTASDVTAAAAAWRKQVSDSTVNRRLGCLRRIWRRAEELWGYQGLARIPWSRLRLFEPDHGDQSIRHADRATFMAALPERSRRVFALAFLTGLRRRGILRIEAKDIDRASGLIHTWSKGRAGGKHTPVPLTTAIEALLATMGPLPEVGRLFPVSERQLRTDIERARAATGLVHIQLRRTRHSFAQDVEDAGYGDIIQALLHHSDPRVRERYRKVREAKKRDVLEIVQGTSRGTRRANGE